MANTYTQIHIQAVFAVQNRQSLIQKEWKSELYKYMTAILQNEGHKLLQINGMPDHVHVFFGMRPTQSLSDLMKKLKGESSKWINKKEFTESRFSWQEGYGAFSYAKSQVPQVIQYIQKQEEHHRIKTFTEEFLEFLQAFEIDYDQKFVFVPVL